MKIFNYQISSTGAWPPDFLKNNSFIISPLRSAELCNEFPKHLWVKLVWLRTRRKETVFFHHPNVFNCFLSGKWWFNLFFLEESSKDLKWYFCSFPKKTTRSWKSKDTLPQNPPFCSKHKHHPEKTIKLVFPVLINLVLLLNFMGIIKKKPVD